METESPPGFTLNLPFADIVEKPTDFPDISEKPTDFSDYGIPQNLRCAPVTNLTFDSDDLQRCNGGVPSPPSQPEEPMETTSESAPEPCQFSHCKGISADAEPEENLVDLDLFPGKIIASSDGVICFLLSPSSEGDVPDIWPILSDTLIHDSSSPVPSSMFPFHFVAIIPDDVLSGRLLRCTVPGSPDHDLPEQYEKLSDLSMQSETPRHPFFTCLLCKPKLFEHRTAFLDHAHQIHDCYPKEDDSCWGGLIQAESSHGTPVCSFLMPFHKAVEKVNSPLAFESASTPLPENKNAEYQSIKDESMDMESEHDNELHIADDVEFLENPDGPEYVEDSYPYSPGFSGPEEQHVEGSSCADGKSSSVECPKCDIVLGSSKSLGGHMTMVHSRNSSKTLKCPKCNWHYKYQETLEIHMKEKHPESEETCPYCLSGQTHPRLARGEVYSCGYKPYRCEICNYSTTSKGNLTIHMQSDKHMNNIQERQKNGSSEVASSELPKSPTEDQPLIPRSSSLSCATQIHRCDMCNYETNVSRNLRIHMTSEKHQQNCNLFLQARMQDMNNTMGMMDPSAVLQLMGMNSEMMKLPFLPSANDNRDGDVFEKIPDNSNVFQCLICVKFMSNSLEELRDHVTADRSGDPDSNTDCLIVSGSQFICKYCQYKTIYKANFQLHCTTAKHLQKLQLVRHVGEGREDFETRLRYLTAGNPVQVRCNACDYLTSSLHQLRHHLENNEQHEVNVSVLLKLRDLQLANTNNTAAAIPENLLSASSAVIPLTITRKLRLFCSLCNFTSKSQSAFMQHVRSLPHYSKWKQQRDQVLTTASSAEEIPTLDYFVTAEIAENSDEKEDEHEHRNGNRVTSDDDAGQLGSDELSTSDDEESGIQSSGTRKDLQRSGSEDLSPLADDHSRQLMRQSFVCPLCQESCTERDILQSHLVNKHNVQTEALERLMMLVETTGIFNKNNIASSPKDSLSREVSPLSNGSDEEKSRSANGISSESNDIFRCQKCSVNFYDIEQLLQHQNATDHLELKQTPRGPGYLCWKKGCNQYFKTTESLQLHFREIHAKKKGSCASSERTPDSDDGMAIDENSHSNGGPEVDDEMNSQSLAESGYKDPNRKYKCHRCKVAFTKQVYLTAHNKTPHHRKGEKSNTSMEKYLDPNRPHKCEVCKESFTQKNILVVHYNSVSHLHKLKKYRQEKRLAELPNGFGELRNGGHEARTLSQVDTLRKSAYNMDDENKPFKCEVCRVQYANSSNLDIHRRSVAHQTRMAREVQERNGNGAVDLSRSTNGVIKEIPSQRMEIDSGVKPPGRPTSEPPVHSVDKESARITSPTSSSPPPSRLRIPGRSRTYGWGSMLESIGSEMVQQFLENQQKPAKALRDKNLEPVDGEANNSDAKSDAECTQCHKVFTSPWILKVHRETAHADIVPVKVLDTVALEYRKIFGEKAKAKNVSAESVVTSSKMPSVEQLPVKKATQPSPSPTPAGNYADLLAAQMQLLPLLYPGLSIGGLNMMGMQAAAMMNLQPPLIAPNGNFSFEGMSMPGMPDLSKNVSNSNQSLCSKLMDLQNGQKRNRTRITDEQLQILRSHFDIRNPPSDDLLQRLCEQTGLELKVVKHWYRNTLFKERQRNKDSPYNFSVPPIVGSALAESEDVEKEQVEIIQKEPTKIPEIVVKEEDSSQHVSESLFIPKNIKREESVESDDSRRDRDRRELSMPFTFSPIPAPGSMSDHRVDDRNGGKRANRTRFTDFQIKSLQDYFDKNPYPKDDDLEDLSRALNLPPRVITVWFQNARQKARKSYENSTPPEDESLQRTAGLNYQCKKCFKVFQKFYEFTRHQKNLCTGTSAGVSSTSRDVDDSCSVASASSFSSSKLGSVKTKADIPVPQQPLWDPNLSAMLGASPFVFPGLYPPNSPFGVLQMEAISSHSQGNQVSASPSNKRRASSDDDGDEDMHSNKRVRTTIQPEQLDYLYQQYKMDSNPSRKQLEIIADKTGLKKRVVQVWYQNTRARERKGQLHLHQMTISKRCPICKIHFKVRTALESHMSIKHADVYCKGDVNIEDLPDTEADSGNERSNLSSPVSQLNRRNHSPPPSSALAITESMMKRLYEDAMKKYTQGGQESGPTSGSVEMSGVIPSTSKVNPSTRVESPLDLSAPHQKMGSSMNSHNDDSGDERDNEGSEGSSYDRSMGSNMNMSSMKPGKRFRTQMSNAQLKVMKRLFADYKTPTMGECELVGREIGLAKRVVQVWFQNARAKEKKNRLSGMEPEKSTTADHCPLCKVTYTSKLTLQDHLFTKSHIALLKASEDCHEGPSSSTSLISQMTPSSSSDRERDSRTAANSSTKKIVDNGERKHSESVSSRKPSGMKTENLAAAQNTQMVNPFGDLGAMMMSDPNMMAYMYASMNPYYNPAAAMSGLMNPYAGIGGFYDPTVHGTALGMLQLPPGAGELIATKLASSDRSAANQSVAFAQDGKRLSDLRESISSSDFACATSTQSDIGSVCRKCQMVFPTEAACKNHQTTACYPGTRDMKNVLKLMQIHFQCSACDKQYPTVSEFKNHCNSASHLKNRQTHSGASLKRPSSNASVDETFSSGRRSRPTV